MGRDVSRPCGCAGVLREADAGDQLDGNGGAVAERGGQSRGERVDAGNGECDGGALRGADRARVDGARRRGGAVEFYIDNPTMRAALEAR